MYYVPGVISVVHVEFHELLRNLYFSSHLRDLGLLFLKN